ncbi:large conductance mechanosensitive channel protein MscL [Sporosarcina sp. YIM B06819]|uniref:large conductance mechanosensitive channel protein MscL n=1 Tax=Sporosarcina sp. YIM B06819 TaxID=3081769 RepID=UPI00298D155C|nr:large conductance mechanosensitive channel protein MscL [Sporosarcina sp. YIM B06819]
MLKDFKEFALKGNIIDLAVAVVIGAAFGKIVSSLVDNIITPLIGLLMGGIDFSGLSYTFMDAKIEYGIFIQNIFDFTIIAFAIFMALRLLMKLKRKEQPVEEVAAVPEVDTKEELLREIRDLLKNEQAE